MFHQGIAPVFISLALLLGASRAAGPSEAPAEASLKSLQFFQKEKEGEEEGKNKGESEGEDESEPEEESENLVLKLTAEEARDLDELKEPSPLELDSSIPRFISREMPPFLMVRPGAGRTKRSKRFKTAGIDGSKWGFVDLQLRKRRIGSRYDKYMALFKKEMDSEKNSKKIRAMARKQFVFYRAQKAKALKELGKIHCQVEWIGNPNIRLQVKSMDRRPGESQKSLRDGWRRSLEASGFSVASEHPERWRGKRVPGYTFLAEGKGRRSAEELWLRYTFFMVPQPRGRGLSVVSFICQAPKSGFSVEIKNSFEAFIRGTQFAR